MSKEIFRYSCKKKKKKEYANNSATPKIDEFTEII